MLPGSSDSANLSHGISADRISRPTFKASMNDFRPSPVLMRGVKLWMTALEQSREMSSHAR
jgi:hypothetical protein